MLSTAPRRITVGLMFLLPLAGMLMAQNRNSKKSQRTAHVRAPQPQDESLVETIKAKMAKSRSLAGMDIKVEATNGVVTLNGTVSSKARKQLAVRIARRVKGVASVIDHIVVGRMIYPGYQCCCNGECYTSSRPCPPCTAEIGQCAADFQQAVVTAHGNRKAFAEAREKFYDCIQKRY